MAKQKLSNEQKELLREQNDKQGALKAEEKKQFNKQFRKTPLFISSWFIRIACLVFFLTAIILNNTTSTINEEKTPLFISSWFIRIACLVFFLTAIILNNTTSTINEEILVERQIKRDSSFQAQTQVISTIYLTTNKGHYTGDISSKIIPGFNVGDTMLIQKNLFGKPTFFTRKHWPYKYELDYGLEVYYIVIFLTLISLGFNDGQDQFTKKILWIFSIADMIAVLCYFLL